MRKRVRPVDGLAPAIFSCAVSLIRVAEFGDRNQFALAGHATSAPEPVSPGTTLALGPVSALGVWFGSML